jgi:hypothetical protein
LPKSIFFERAKPQYEDTLASSFLHMKDYVARDGVTDDTAVFQKALDLNADKSTIIFVDSGSYILTDTVTIPRGVKLVGEAWSQIVTSGDKFADVTSPRLMLKVGNTRDVGNVKMQDLLFTTIAGTAGVILVEWNLKADGQGTAGL